MAAPAAAFPSFQPVPCPNAAPLLSQAYRPFCVLTALMPATAASSRVTPSATATAVSTSRTMASRPPFRVSRSPSRIMT